MGGHDGGAGTTGAGGATPSSGCGKAPPASTRYSIDVGGMMREYILAVPTNYNPNTPYRLIFAWHARGGSAQGTAGTGNSGYYGLRGASNNQAILVSPEGLDFRGNGLGWGNTNGHDIAFLRAMLERFKSGDVHRRGPDFLHRLQLRRHDVVRGRLRRIGPGHRPDGGQRDLAAARAAPRAWR